MSGTFYFSSKFTLWIYSFSWLFSWKNHYYLYQFQWLYMKIMNGNAVFMIIKLFAAKRPTSPSSVQCSSTPFPWTPRYANSRWINKNIQLRIKLLIEVTKLPLDPQICEFQLNFWLLNSCQDFHFHVDDQCWKNTIINDWQHDQ